MPAIELIPEIKMYTLFKKKSGNDHVFFTYGEYSKDAFILESSGFRKVENSVIRDTFAFDKNLIHKNLMFQISDTLHRKESHFKRFLFNDYSGMVPCVVQLSKVEKNRIIASLEFQENTVVFIFNNQFDERFASTLFSMVSAAESFYDNWYLDQLALGA